MNWVIRFVERREGRRYPVRTNIDAQGKTLEEALSIAYHSLRQTSEETKAGIVSVSITSARVPALEEVTS